MKKMFNEGNQIHNFMSTSGSGTVINYGSGSDFLTSYGSGYGSGSSSQKVTVPTVPVPVPVPQHWFFIWRLDLMILIGANPLLGPSEGIGPHNVFARVRHRLGPEWDA